MATSSQPLIIDLLVAKFQALATSGAFGNDQAGNPLQVSVYDGPEGQDEDVNIVCVFPPPEETNGSLEWAYMGDGGSRYENYDILVGIWSWVGGDDNDTSNADNAQQAARYNASQIESAIEAAMLADRNLRIQNGGSEQACIWALINSASYTQSPPPEEDDAEGSFGRYAQWLLKVHVYNVLGGG